MKKGKIQELLRVIEGISYSDWTKIRQQVDMHFSSKAAKIELDDSPELKRNLEVAFNLRRFGEKLD